MFKVVCSGTNKNYGKRNKIRLLNDSHSLVAVKKGWIRPNIKYEGNGRNNLIIIDVKHKCRLCGKELGAD